MFALMNGTIQKTKSSTILQRLAEKDKTAVKECIDTYGDFIWTLARKHTNLTEEAEVATQKIFSDIWQYAESGGKIPFEENIIIARIAQRRLKKRSAMSRTISMGDIDGRARGRTNGNSEAFRSFRSSTNGADKTENPEHFRVLYADDNEDARFMVKIMLEIADIDVATANTITEAWKLAQSEYFDLYLLDSRFPDGNGLDLCRGLREHAPHAPILFYSGRCLRNRQTKRSDGGSYGLFNQTFFGKSCSDNSTKYQTT